MNAEEEVLSALHHLWALGIEARRYNDAVIIGASDAERLARLLEQHDAEAKASDNDDDVDYSDRDVYGRLVRNDNADE